MCLSAVYEIRNGTETLVSEHVGSIVLDGGKITLTDIMGEEIVITGSLKSVDLVRNVIKIEARQ